MTKIHAGQVVWVDSFSHAGREQGGRRPHLVVCSDEYLALVDTMFISVPLTTTNRGWRNHIPVRGPTGLTSESWIMTEQVRTLSRERIFGVMGDVSSECLRRARLWVAEFLGVVT